MAGFWEQILAQLPKDLGSIRKMPTGATSPTEGAPGLLPSVATLAKLFQGQGTLTPSSLRSSGASTIGELYGRNPWSQSPFWGSAWGGGRARETGAESYLLDVSGMRDFWRRSRRNWKRLLMPEVRLPEERVFRGV